MTARIVVAGSLNIDRRIRLPRIPAPGETVIATRAAEEDLGGKGCNQAVAASRLGADVTLITAIGSDAHGQVALGRLRTEALTVDAQTLDTHSTGEALILLAEDGENSIVVQAGANAQLTFPPHHSQLLKDADVLVLQLEIPLVTAASFAEAAHRHGTRVVTNIAPVPSTWSTDLARLLAATDTLIANEIESEQLLALLPGANTSIPDAILGTGSTTLIVTRGSEGITAYTNSEQIQIPAMRVVPVDTTGAGDACVAGISVALAEGLDVARALALGNASGAITVQREGTVSAFATRAEVDDLLAARPVR